MNKGRKLQVLPGGLEDTNKIAVSGHSSQILSAILYD